MAAELPIGDGLDDASRLLKAMASPNRLLLLCALAGEEKSVVRLAEELDLRQPTVSQHLARLRGDGLVVTRRDAQMVYYRIADDTAKKIISVLHDAYCGND
jgi:DNA-binding transcriptional ArsR family regulator